MKNSEYIEAFLNYLKECEENFRIAESIEKDKDMETQDILHYIELGNDIHPDDCAYIVFKLRQVRRERRQAKDTQRLTKPVKEWAASNRKIIREAEKLLGEVRRQEKYLNNRAYSPKTKVMDFLRR